MNDSRRCGVFRIRNAIAKFVNDIAAAQAHTNTRTHGRFISSFFFFFFLISALTVTARLPARLVMIIIINLRLEFRNGAVCIIANHEFLQMLPNSDYCY